jgi:hypothetical protein
MFPEITNQPVARFLRDPGFVIIFPYVLAITWDTPGALWRQISVWGRLGRKCLAAGHRRAGV